MAKNLLVGDDVTYDRKMREMIVASRIERVLTKAEILEIYLNSIYLGRSSWGIEMAARSYFGKSAKSLSVAESALLAGLAKGPNYYNPDTKPERAQERMAYVLSRMQEDAFLTPDEMQRAVASLPERVRLRRLRRTTGFYFVDHVESRCAHARRYRGPDRRGPIRCAPPSTRLCSRRPRPPCRRGSHATS